LIFIYLHSINKLEISKKTGFNCNYKKKISNILRNRMNTLPLFSFEQLEKEYKCICPLVSCREAEIKKLPSFRATILDFSKDLNACYTHLWEQMISKNKTRNVIALVLFREIFPEKNKEIWNKRNLKEMAEFFQKRSHWKSYDYFLFLVSKEPGNIQGSFWVIYFILRLHCQRKENGKFRKWKMNK